MLREFMVNAGDVAPAQYVAASELKTGAPVVVDRATGTVSVSTTETASDIFVVDKEHYPTGVYAGLTNMSDYHENYNTVAKGENVKLCAYTTVPEAFGTTEYDATVVDGAVGKRLAAKSGKWTLATKLSRYVFAGFVNDNGHKLAKIVVSDIAEANA